jgi:integrase
MNPEYISQSNDKENQLNLVEVLKIKCPKCSSQEYIKQGISQSGKQKYRCKNCQYTYVLNSAYKSPEKSDDVWTAEDLGLQVKLHLRGDKLNFSYIEQEWLKLHIKKFIRYFASTSTSFESVQQCLYHFKVFSIFVSQNSTINKMEDINRSVIIEYLYYLNKTQLAPKTKCHHLSALASLFETGIVNKWFNVDSYLIRKEDYPRSLKPLPRYIPEEVIHQLNQHLNTLPEPIMRMVLVMQECGLRIGELCLLPLNCLRQDSKGGWFIQFMRPKMRFETTLPISIELAQVIKEQQAYIQQH